MIKESHNRKLTDPLKVQKIGTNIINNIDN